MYLFLVFITVVYGQKIIQDRQEITLDELSSQGRRFVSKVIETLNKYQAQVTVGTVLLSGLVTLMIVIYVVNKTKQEKSDKKITDYGTCNVQQV